MVQPHRNAVSITIDVGSIVVPAGIIGTYEGGMVEFRLTGKCTIMYTPHSGRVTVKCDVDHGQTHGGGDLIGDESGELPSFLLEAALRARANSSI